MSYWQGKVVLVTGGSAGLGLALARRFQSGGAKVVIVGRDEARLASAAESLKSGARVTPIAADITRDDDVGQMVDQTIQEHGHLNALVNCAGRSSRGTLLETPLDEYRSQWELNFLALVRCTQAAAPYLVHTKGHVVNIGSLAAKSASRFIGAYATTKFPVAAFSQQLRLELKETGVHVLLVCPGPIQRDDISPRYETDGLPESAKKPGGGVKLKGLSPDYLADRILRACERRQPELVIPWKARLLFAIGQLSPAWGDWILRRMT